MAYRVLKKLKIGGGQTLPIGSIVDGADWKNLRTLVGNRYLVEVEVDVAGDVEVDGDAAQPKGKAKRKSVTASAE